MVERAGAEPTQHEPVEGAVQRQRDEVVEHQRGDEPRQHAGGVGAAEELDAGVGGDCKARQQADEVARRGPVRAHHAKKAIRATHLV
jgi:hypothetical protein